MGTKENPAKWPGFRYWVGVCYTANALLERDTASAITMIMKFKKIPYNKLNARQQENHNFHKIAATLADYGFNMVRLSDDWQGADAIAIHSDQKTFLKVQIKGRLSFDKKYIGKNIWISFQDQKTKAYYLYKHDILLKKLPAVRRYVQKMGGWSTPSPSVEHRRAMERYML